MENFQYMFIEGVGSFELGVCFLVGVGCLACVLLLHRSPPIMLIIESGIGSIFQHVVEPLSNTCLFGVHSKSHT